MASAERGIESNSAVTGSCTITMPKFSITIFSPSVPSEPSPEQMMHTARSRASLARLWKKKSMGSRRPAGWVGANNSNMPCKMLMSWFGGMTYTRLGRTRRPSEASTTGILV